MATEDRNDHEPAFRNHSIGSKIKIKSIYFSVLNAHLIRVVVPAFSGVPQPWGLPGHKTRAGYY